MRTINFDDLSVKEYPVLYYRDGLVLLPDLETCVFYADYKPFENFFWQYQANYADKTMCRKQLGANPEPILAMIEREHTEAYIAMQHAAGMSFIVKDLLSKGFKVFPF